MTASLAARPSGTAPDWTIPQAWDSYSAEDHAVWDTLYARQIALLKERASAPFLRGLDTLRMSRSGIPDFEELSERLHKLTGWRVVAVEPIPGGGRVEILRHPDGRRGPGAPR